MISPYERYMAEKAAKLNDDVKLQRHQKEFVSRLEENNGSLLAAHGMGTGKTVSSIAAIEHLRSKGVAGVTLAVTPAPLRDNFIENGVHMFTDQKAVRLGSRGERGSRHIDGRLPSASYYVVSNEMFRKDPQKYLDRTGADTVIWDEAHKGRDTATANYGAMMSIRPRVKNFIALTGTPTMNHPHDILPVLDIVTNRTHGLGRTPKEFDKMFIGTKKTHHGPLGFMGIGPHSEETVLKNTDYLRHELAKHVHYVPTEQVAKNMPKKVVHTHEVEMSDHQKKLYDFAMSKVDPLTRFRIKNNLPVGTREASHVFSMITQARQASNAVHTLDSTHTASTSAAHTPKARRVIDDVTAHLAKHPKNKAVIYTNLFHGGVDQMVEGLRAKGIEAGMFVGSGHQKRQERSAHVADYLAGKKRVMVINQAGTEGLNLPGTTAHFTLDGHFNPAMTEQAEARGIRAGSPVKEVEVHRYKSVLPKPLGLPFLPRETGTDEWVYGIADRKDQLNQQFTSLMKAATPYVEHPHG